MKRILITLLLLVTALNAKALDPNGFEQITHVGNVFARSIVYDESTGLPLWAEYNEQGGFSKIQVNLAKAYAGRVVSGSSYRTYISAFDAFKERYEGKVELLARQQYLDKASSGGFTSNTGQPITNWDTNLPKDVLSVVVPAKEKRFQFDANQIEKLYFPVDLVNFPNVSDDIKSVLIDETGSILYQSDMRIGFLSAFYHKEGEVPTSASEYEFGSSIKRLYDYKILDPVPGVFIEATTGYINGATVSDEDGKYSLHMRPSPCPGFIYHPEVDAYARLYYANFNPKGSPAIPYYLVHRSYNSCNGLALLLMSSGNLVGLMTAINIMAMVAAAPENIHYINYAVAINVLAGQAFMAGASIVEDTTEYHAEESPLTKYMAPNDFDGDGQLDGMVRGSINSDGLFTPSEAGEHYGVYLSASPRSDGQPNFTRVIDIFPDARHKGLVKKISKDDLQKTDILVFRESTGELVTERSGLSDDDLNSTTIGGIELDQNNNFSYSMPIRSTEDQFSFTRQRFGGWQDWQAEAKMNPNLHAHKSDFLRNGEQLRVVAINRSTGYIGSVITALTGPKDGGDVTVMIPPILMGPPNLKVWATRRYQPQGLQASADKERHMIGNEGAATTDDYLIEVHTQWLDGNGFPLPDALKDRGYTGRLVKVAADPSASTDVYNTQVTEFPINPGTQLQVIKFSEGEAGKYHYHLQVNAKSDATSNDFATGNHQGVLRHRPNLYVPVKVPLYNEQLTNLNQLYQEQAGEDVDEVDAAFDWVYRPELSFSVVDLEMESIIRKTIENEDVDIKDEKQPIISASDSAIELIYKLIGSNFDRITPLDGEQTYILALGEQEVEIEVAKGSGGQKRIQLGNVEHLTQIDTEDFLTLRLYLNEDSQNTLWKYAFDLFQLRPGPIQDTDDPYIYVTADEAHENDEYVYGLVLSENEDNTPYNVKWKQVGGNGISPSQQTNAEGVFSAALNLPVKADTTVRVSASINNNDKGFKTATYKILPGAPKTITVDSTSGSTSIFEQGEFDVVLSLKDSFGNTVVDGTPVTVEADDLLVTGDLSTVDGTINLTFQGQRQSGNKTVTIKSGEAEETLNINVGDIQLSLQVPSELGTKETATVTLNASGDSDGLVVNIGANRGKLSQSQVVIQNGQANVELFTGSFRGSGHVFARVGDEITHRDFMVKEPDELNYMLDSVVVKDAPSGSIQVSGAEFNYTNSTQLRIKGTPGESVAVSLGSAANPIIKPLLSYQFNEQRGSGLIEDKQGDFNAYAQNANIVSADLPGQGQVMELNNGSQITTAMRSQLAVEQSIGFTTQIKASIPGSLIDYAASGLSLSLESDNSLTLSASINSNTVSVNSGAVDVNSWLEVGAHYHDDELILSVNGQEFKQSASGKLDTNGSANKAITIGGNSSQNIQIASFALIDWADGLPALALSGGSLSGQYTVDDDGYAKVNIGVPASTLAYYEQRRFEKRNEMLANSRFSLFKQAYAQNGAGDCQVQPTNPDYVLSQAEAMLEVVLKCVLGKQIEQAEVRYQTADGWKEKAVAMVEETALKAIYTQLNWSGKGLLVAADCLQGVLTGNPQSGVGATCDFISSLLLIGDVRDLIFQGYYWFVDDQENFSPMTATFATLGLASSALSAVSGPAGGSIALAAAAAKQIPKAFKGAKFIKPLGTYIDKFILIDDWKKAAKNMERVLPFIELTAFVGFTAFSPEMKVVRDFISSAIEDPEDLYAWIDYLEEMAKTLAGGGSVAVNLDTHQQLQKAMYAATAWIVAEALAKNFWDDLKTPTVDSFIKIIEKSLEPPSINKDKAKIPSIFTKAIKDLTKQGKDTNVIDALKHQPETVRALGLAFSLGGEEALRRLRNYRGFAGGAGISYEDVMKKLGSIDIDKLTDKQKKGLAHIIKNFDTAKGTQGDTVAFFKSSGATFELLDIVKHFDDISGIQFKFPFTSPSGLKMERVYDYVLKNGWHVDKKAWAPGKVKERIKASMKSDLIIPGEEKTGQLFRDMIAAQGGKKIRWSFDARSKGVLSTDKIKDMVKESAMSEFPSLAKALKLDLDDFDTIQKKEKILDTILKNFDVEIGEF